MNVAHLLRQRIAVAAYQSTTEWGEPGYSAPRTIPARVEWSDGVAPAGEGEQVTVTATLATLERIGSKDRIWLPRPGESAPAPSDVADATKARTPNAEGCAASTNLAGGTDFYVTKV